MCVYGGSLMCVCVWWLPHVCVYGGSLMCVCMVAPSCVCVSYGGSLMCVYGGCLTLSSKDTMQSLAICSSLKMAASLWSACFRSCLLRSSSFDSSVVLVLDTASSFIRMSLRQFRSSSVWELVCCTWDGYPLDIVDAWGLLLSDSTPRILNTSFTKE